MGAPKQQVASASRKQRRVRVAVIFGLCAFLFVAVLLGRVYGAPEFMSRALSSQAQFKRPESLSGKNAVAASRQVKLFDRAMKAQEEENKEILTRGFPGQDMADVFANMARDAATAKKEEANVPPPEPILPPFVAEAISQTDSVGVQFEDKDPRLLSQKGQDKWLLKTFFKGGNQQSGRGFFVEFGARNGQEESNSFFFEKVLGWNGILAEASPADQRDIATNRSHSAVVNGAMCKDESKREYGELQYGLSGLIEKYDRNRMIERGGSMKKLAVQCYRLDKVLDFLGVKAIDYMSVDTEGSELEALSAFPFDRIPCQIIGIEVLVGRGREGRTNRTVEFMAERGYRLFHPYEVAPDTLDMFFVPKELKDPSVFIRPRVDVGQFFDARSRCQKLDRMCL